MKDIDPIQILEQEIAELEQRKATVTAESNARDIALQDLRNTRAGIVARISTAAAQRLAGVACDDDHDALCLEASALADQITSAERDQEAYRGSQAASALIDQEIYRRREQILQLQWDVVIADLDGAQSEVVEATAALGVALRRLRQAQTACSPLVQRAKILRRVYDHSVSVSSYDMPFVQLLEDAVRSFRGFHQRSNSVHSKEILEKVPA